MTITGALVLFASIWFLSLFVALPIGLRTHGDEGTSDDETPASSPINANIKRKMLWVTVFTVAVWVPLCVVIWSGMISVRDIDFWGRMDLGPGAEMRAR